MKSLFEQKVGTYRQEGDYLLPNLELPKDKHQIGKYGRMRKRYLKQDKRWLYSSLLMSGKLNEHLHEIDEQSQVILNQFIRSAELTAPDKATHQMEWVGHFNNAKVCAEEVINHELIYV